MSLSAHFRDWFIAPVLSRLAHLENTMADSSALLTDVANGLRGLGGAVSTLVAENVALRTRNAELEGEDAGESTAAADVKVAFDELAAKLTETPDAPDVEPLPIDESV